MAENLVSKIEKQLPSFSKGQKLIATYISDHCDEAAFMTASKLGNAVGVSESTVVRFATELGYDGYPKLQHAMQEMIREKLTSVQRIDVAAKRIGKKDILEFILQEEIDRINSTIEETSKEDFYNAVDALSLIHI